MNKALQYMTIGAFIIVAMIYGAFILKPICLAILLAMWFEPIVSRVEQWTGWRSLGYALSTIAVFGFLGLGSLAMGSQLKTLFSQYQSGYFEVDQIADSVETYADDIGLNTDMTERAISSAVSYSGQLITSVFELVLSGSGDILLTISLGFFLGYFISRYSPALRSLLFDQKDSPYLRFIQGASRVCFDYIKGVSIVMVILAAIMSIIYSVIGLDYALVWGVLTGLLAFIPYLGSLIAVILPIAYSIMTTNSFVQPAQIFLAFMIVQQIEGNILTPKVIGEAVSINPLTAIIFLVVCGQIWGVFGVFISLMLAGIIKVAVESFAPESAMSIIMGNQLNSEKS